MAKVENKREIVRCCDFVHNEMYQTLVHKHKQIKHFAQVTRENNNKGHEEIKSVTTIDICIQPVHNSLTDTFKADNRILEKHLDRRNLMKEVNLMLNSLIKWAR
jgi:hypothetical protein